jgi:hypothetical protein
MMELVIKDQTVALMFNAHPRGQIVALEFNVHPRGQTEVLPYKGHLNDQRVVQTSVNHQVVPAHGNRIPELQEIQVPVFLQKVLVIVNLQVVGPASNDHPAGPPTVQIQGVQETQITVKGEDTDLPLICYPSKRKAATRLLFQCL